MTLYTNIRQYFVIVWNVEKIDSKNPNVLRIMKNNAFIKMCSVW